MTLHRLAAAVLASATLSTAAFAAPAPETPQAVVRYADLDLASPAGARALQARVNRAVALVCGTADPRDLTAWSQIEACRTAARASATPQVETALANAHTGRAVAAIDVRSDVRGF